jgi:site-specific recombinase XerD
MKTEVKKIRGIFEKVSGSGVWWICYFDAIGKKRREKAGRRSDALDLYRKRKAEALQGKKLPEKLRVKAVSFSALADAVIEYSKAHKVSYKHDEYRIAKLKEEFGNRTAESITPQEFERWISDHEKWKPATANRYRALLSLTYRLGIQNGKVSANPARMMRHRRENNARIRWLTPQEEKSLRTAVEAIGPEHLPELEVAIHTGLRKSEQYRLTWSCVDFERQILTVPQSKNGETRHVPLNSAALAAFLLLRKHSSPEGRVFGAVGPRQWFEPAVGKSGIIEFTWHCLRHTFASRLVMAGVDLRTVQELMGHKTIAMTCRYAHLAPSHMLAAVERLTTVEPTPSESSSDSRSDTDTSGKRTDERLSVQ